MEPLGALVEACVRERPDLVYLCGPFVDKDHPLVKEGKVDLEHEEIFELCCDKLKGLPEGTKAVLVPSVRDVHHDACFPQSAFRVRGMPGDVREKLVCAPNPAVISGAGLTVAPPSPAVPSLFPLSSILRLMCCRSRCFCIISISSSNTW